MTEGKFFKISLGPVHFETRFKPFMEIHKDCLDFYTHVVDNYDLYEPYKDQTTIVDLKKYQDNNPWSKKHEILYDERDPEKFIAGYRTFTFGERNFYPLDLMRAALLNFYEDDVLNFSFIGSNIPVTQNRDSLNDYFKSIPSGTFGLAVFGEDGIVKYHHTDHIKEDLQKLHPNMVIGDEYLYFDGWIFSFHFRNKEELLLFYTIWDDFMRLYHENYYAKGTLGTSAGYTQYESVIGYIMKIFKDSLQYEIRSILDFWNLDKHGRYVSSLHDTFMYHQGGNIRHSNSYPFILDENINTVREFIRRNRDALEKYHFDYGHNLEYKILEDNITIKFKN